MLLAANTMEALNMMWQGMLGIFIVVGIIAGAVTLLTRLTGKKKDKKSNEDDSNGTEE